MMAKADKDMRLTAELAALSDLTSDVLRERWRALYKSEAPGRASRSLLIGAIAYKLQEHSRGGLSAATRKFLRATASGIPAASPIRQFKPGTMLLRDWRGVTHEVTVLDKGVLYRGKTYRSLTRVAAVISGVHRSGPEFFGVKAHDQG